MRALMIGRRGTAATFNLTATTTGAATLTLQRITPTGGTCTVSWGDGSADSTIAAGNIGTTTHAYAGAGTWAVKISNPLLITYFDVRDTKLSCVAGQIGALKSLQALHLDFVANIMVGAGEIGGLTSLTYLYLYNSANITAGAGEIGGLSSLTYLYLRSVANVTVGAGEIGGLLNLATLVVYTATKVTIGATEIGSLTNLTGLIIIGSSNVAFQTGIGNLLKLTTVQYENTLSQAQVDSVLAQLYAAFPTRTGTNGTIDVAGGSNAAPSGTYQAANPPTTGKEYAYELVNDSAGVSTKHWATVTTS